MRRVNNRFNDDTVRAAVIVELTHKLHIKFDKVKLILIQHIER